MATEQKQRSKQKKVKGTIDKVDGKWKLEEPTPLFEVPGKAMVSGKVIGVGKSGVETNVESGEMMTKEDGVCIRELQDQRGHMMEEIEQLLLERWCIRLLRGRRGQMMEKMVLLLLGG